MADTPFKEIWKSERYWEVVDLIASDRFDAKTMCGSLCLQHKVNEFLWDIKQNKLKIKPVNSPAPDHINFI